MTTSTIEILPAPRRQESRLLRPLLRQVKKGIRSGKISAGNRLPPVREMAREHNISYSLALQAVEQLEREGLVERFQGRGTYVKRGAASQSRTQDDGSWVSLILDPRQHVVGNLNTCLLQHLM